MRIKYFYPAGCHSGVFDFEEMRTAAGMQFVKPQFIESRLLSEADPVPQPVF
jgi:hypothetical protein